VGQEHVVVDVEGTIPVERGLAKAIASKDGLGLNPQVSGFELATPEGELVRLNDHRGRFVLLNFWASY